MPQKIRPCKYLITISFITFIGIPLRYFSIRSCIYITRHNIIYGSCRIRSCRIIQIFDNNGFIHNCMLDIPDIKYTIDISDTRISSRGYSRHNSVIFIFKIIRTCLPY